MGSKDADHNMGPEELQLTPGIVSTEEPDIVETDIVGLTSPDDGLLVSSSFVSSVTAASATEGSSSSGTTENPTEYSSVVSGIPTTF